LEDHIQCMLFDANMSIEWWEEALQTATYIYNCTVSTHNTITPYERWYGAKPDLSHMRPFGAIAHTINEKAPTLENRTKECRLIGYSGGSNYKLYNESTKRRINSRNVTFDESSFNGCNII